ncbi:MAG: DUF2461 domain-containing protein [Actinobacteria bacterium]|nr:DUF2461 domain-containing protein [Actinomycetota bacterium]
MAQTQALPGIPLDAVDFFTELEYNNERPWWTAQQDRWKRSVRDPMQALCDGLSDEFGAAKLFRPHRDVRFSSDKSPYKVHQGAVVGTSPGVGLYVQVSRHGLMTGAGWYQSTPAQVAAFREAVVDDDSGAELEAIVARLVDAGVAIGGDQLTSAPRGIASDHPRIALLRHRTLRASRDQGTPDWLEEAAVIDHVRQDWRDYAPLIAWFGAHLDVDASDVG